jgi:anti-sigma factor RsiW
MLRHCTMDELLNLRDGEGSAWTRTHLDECADCRAELESLHQRVAALKALPSFSPPRDRWLVVQERLRQSRRRARWQRTMWAGLTAAAAAVALFVAGRTLIGPGTPELVAQEVSELQHESQQLEEVLHTVANERRVVKGVTVAVIVALEDRIAVIDAGIASIQRDDDRVTIELRDLWRERVELMDQLVITHVNQVSSVGY